jgi:hypothetical protein
MCFPHEFLNDCEDLLEKHTGGANAMNAVEKEENRGRCYLHCKKIRRFGGRR